MRQEYSAILVARGIFIFIPYIELDNFREKNGKFHLVAGWFSGNVPENSVHVEALPI